MLTIEAFLEHEYSTLLDKCRPFLLASRYTHHRNPHISDKYPFGKDLVETSSHEAFSTPQLHPSLSPSKGCISYGSRYQIRMGFVEGSRWQRLFLQVKKSRGDFFCVGEVILIVFSVSI